MICVLWLICLLPRALAHHDPFGLYVMSAFVVLAAVILLWIALSTKISPPRRVFAQFIDVLAISTGMLLFGEPAAPLFLVYLWVTLGSGFRFGPAYLLSELAMSVVGFGIVIYASPFWSAHPSVGIGLLIGMLGGPSRADLVAHVRRGGPRRGRQPASATISMVSHELCTR